ncbi:MAG: hypothetical protein J7M12_00455, partial [Candidatus Hydrogenedentes bacterium]|nr:hypothetical protein [Candidatus Hydrogenedentota bacterium]
MRSVSVILAIVLLLAPAASFGLSPDEILIIVSSSGPEGTGIARKYCDARHVPESQIAAFPMPGSETISRNDYDTYISGPLRRFFGEHPDIKSRVRCLLTVYGVPLRIGGYTPSATERRTIVALENRLDKMQSAIRERIDLLRDLAVELDVPVPSGILLINDIPPSLNSLPKDMLAVRAFLKSISARLDTVGRDGQHAAATRSRFDRIETYLAGSVQTETTSENRSRTGEVKT